MVPANSRIRELALVFQGPIELRYRSAHEGAYIELAGWVPDADFAHPKYDPARQCQISRLVKAESTNVTLQGLVLCCGGVNSPMKITFDL